MNPLRGLLAVFALLSSACNCGGNPLVTADVRLDHAAVLDFGDVTVGTSVEKTTAVRNLGRTRADVLSVTASGPFTTALAGFSIDPSGERILRVGFVPTTPGPAEGELVLELPKGATASIRLIGNGIAAVPGCTTPCDDADPCTVSDACDEAGRCRGTAMRCDQPPAVACTDAQTLTRYSGGACVAGACTWQETRTACPGGCASGACTPEAPSRFVYPVVWPKAGGGIITAVPLADADVTVYRMIGAPHASAFDRPVPMSSPELQRRVTAGEPLVLWAPLAGMPGPADEDHFVLFSSTAPMVVTVADDERHQIGSPDRIFFVPSTTGTLRGRVFYGPANGGESQEMIRVTNLGSATAQVTADAWVGNAWQTQGSFTVPAGTEAQWHPTRPQSAYRISSSEDAVVAVGYLVDNAVTPAVDLDTGLTVGSRLYGYAAAWQLRAVDAVSYVVESRPSGSTTWTQVTSGTLAAGGATGATLSAQDLWVRITLTGGKGWALTGTSSMSMGTEWNGFYLPPLADGACTLASRFSTHGAGRSIAVLPNTGTTVTFTDDTSGAMLGQYTSKGPWEFHNVFFPNRVRATFSQGPGALMFVGTLNWGGCDESASPGNCGILEGGYVVPSFSGFRCTGAELSSCTAQLASGC